MNRLFLCFSLCMAAIGSSSFAAVIERDWKTPGDGLLTYDTVNKREWLDLSQTILDDRFPGSGSTALEIRESRYQYVVGQTAPDGLFEGFTVAKRADVIALAQSAGIDTSTGVYAVNAGPISVLQGLLSITLERPITNKYSIGLLGEGNPPYPYRLGAIFGLTDRAELVIDDPTLLLQSNGPHAVMLYRVVPEPNSLVAFVIGISGLSQWLRIRQ